MTTKIGYVYVLYNIENPHKKIIGTTIKSNIKVVLQFMNKRKAKGKCLEFNIWNENTRSKIQIEILEPILYKSNSRYPLIKRFRDYMKKYNNENYVEIYDSYYFTSIIRKWINDNKTWLKMDIDWMNAYDEEYHYFEENDEENNEENDEDWIMDEKKKEYLRRIFAKLLGKNNNAMAVCI